MPGTHLTPQQVRRYMKHRSHGPQILAAAKAGISERTARRIDDDHDAYLDRASAAPRKRTREDPLEGYWDERIVPMLEANPSLMAVTIFEELQDELGEEQFPDRIRRTLERRVRHWRCLHGQSQEVFFPQKHPPGQRGLSDFTDGRELSVTIAGQPFEHRLYHFRMACSGWEYAEVVLGGESFAALSKGLQKALWQLGGVPQEHRTDSLSAAFRNLTADQQVDLTKRYQDLCRHYGMKPTRNNPGEANENGTIEAANKHLKRRLDQALRRRGDRDFATLDDDRSFVAKVIDRHNNRRRGRVAQEASALSPLPDRKTTAWSETAVVVTSRSTIAVDRVTYTVPSRLIGERLRIHLHDDRLEAFLGADIVFATDRVRATGINRTHKVDYRHVIDQLIRKPQAFRAVVYRDKLFPRPEYQRAWETIDKALPEREACKVMVGLLHLAAHNGCEADLAEHLAALLDADQLPDLAAIRDRFARPQPAVKPEPFVAAPDLGSYDQLLTQTLSSSQTAPAEARP